MNDKFLGNNATSKLSTKKLDFVQKKNLLLFMVYSRHRAGPEPNQNRNLSKSEPEP